MYFNQVVSSCDGSKDSNFRHSMPSIEMLEVAYLYGYLLVSAQVFTPENDIINASLCRHSSGLLTDQTLSN
jgi:hypothetical protein